MVRREWETVLLRGLVCCFDGLDRLLMGLRLGDLIPAQVHESEVIRQLVFSPNLTLELVVQQCADVFAGSLAILVANPDRTEARALASAGDDDLARDFPKTVCHESTSNASSPPPVNGR